MRYNHTQTGTLMICIALTVAVFFTFILMQPDVPLATAALMVPILLLIASFSTLNVTIDAQALRIKFGYGIFRKRFALQDIESAKTVRNKWYYGWGIRFWPRPPTWIFNVSGFDAVEIQMKSGAIYRIGTDDPENLQRAIMRAKPGTTGV